MWCPRNSLNKSLEALEDLFGGLCPPHALRVLVRSLNELLDCFLQLSGASVNAAPNLSLGEEAKETLDEIEPGRVRGREVCVESWPSSEPFRHGRSLVRSVVVHDDVDIEFFGDVLVKSPKKLEELLRSMPAMALRNHLAGCYIESGEE